MKLNIKTKDLKKIHNDMLYDNVIIPSLRESALINPESINLSSAEFETLKSITEKANNIVIKVLNLLISNEVEGYNIDIPSKEVIMKNKGMIKDFFLARSDVFKRRDGKFFIAEINYCKPSGHKELDTEFYFNIENNPNAKFKEIFLNGIEEKFNDYYKGKEKEINIALVCDTYKYEEITLAHYYKSILEKKGYNLDIVGINNIKVIDNSLWAYGKKFNVMFRKFPMEFTNEFPQYPELQDLYIKGNLLIINEPRSILGQNKDVFSLLWKLTNTKLLSKEEIKFIKTYIPFTINLKDYIKSFSSKEDAIKQLSKDKDKWVMKEVFTRYSEGVYLGKMMSINDWLKGVYTATELPGKFILQKFVPIKNEPIFSYYANKEQLMEEDTLSYDFINKSIRFNNRKEGIINNYINYGVHLVNGKYAGMFARCSPNLITHEDTVFMNPINIIDREETL